MSTDELVAEGGRPNAEYPMRFSSWKVGAVLMAVVALVLGSAIVVNSQLRGRVGVEPLPTVLPAAQTESAANQATAEGRPLQQEITDAYLRFWDVRAEAQRTLDTTGLAKVAAGDQLGREIQQVEDLRARGRAGKVDVEHNFVIIEAKADEAILYDEYLNKSLLIDVATGNALPTSQPPMTQKTSYELRKIDGVWKVVDGARHP